MATLSGGLAPSIASGYSCSGRRIGAVRGVYHVAAMKFLISHPETKLASTDRQSQDSSINPSEEQKRFSIWENYVTRYALFEVFTGVMPLNTTKESLVMPRKEQYVFRVNPRAGWLISPQKVCPLTSNDLS